MSPPRPTRRVDTVARVIARLESTANPRFLLGRVEPAEVGTDVHFLYIDPDRNIVVALNSAYADCNSENNLEVDMAAGLQAIATHVGANR